MADNDEAKIAKDTAHGLLRIMNSYSAKNNAETVLEDLICAHPTSQQTFTGNIILNYIRLMANKYVAGNYDRRNEMACYVCSKMWNQVKGDIDGKENVWVKLPMV